MSRAFVPEFENGKLVKLDGQRPEYMGGYDLIRATKHFASRVAELETLLARQLVFDHGAAEDGLDALGGWNRMLDLMIAYREANPLPESDMGITISGDDGSIPF